jgi:transcriptional regulator with XRE-family HTH domain
MKQANAVAKKIRERRLSMNLSQEALAALVGVSRQCISLWENSGEVETVKASNLVAIEKALGFKAGELFRLYYA